MKILMVAPEPFFQPRGTPFSEYYRIRCLSELGHTVDLVTYHIGDDVEIEGLNIIRAPGVPGIDEIKIGPSFQKIPLDVSLFFKAWKVLAERDYDVIHSHEEAGIMSVFLSRMYGIPHVYDMHSSLPDQLSTFKFTENKVIHGAFNWMEHVVLSSADEVIAICPSLVEKVREMEPRARVTLIENVAESHAVDQVSESAVASLRSSLDIAGKRIILYIGTFETYQGLGMLLEACATMFTDRRDTVLVMVGGREEQVKEVRNKASDLGIEQMCRFTGMVPHDQVPAYLKLADVLVSPRIYGTNTPLKIYSYLRSGRPIVATNLYTHTQVLNDWVSMLVDPEPQALASGMTTVLDNPDLAKRLSAAAYKLSEENYSYTIYVERTRTLFERLERKRYGRS
jgi:glycosyltransferase involved in cell wall biosynthesis